VRVRFLAGTEVDAGALEQLLRHPGISVTADAPFLSCWIASRRLGPASHRATVSDHEKRC
jgi:hypothetical protein